MIRPVRGRIATFVVAMVGVSTAVVVTLFIVQRATQPLGAGDLFWQLRTGQTILDTGVIPDTETYSYTVAGAPWNNHEWLYEATLAAWHRATGWLGLRSGEFGGHMKRIDKIDADKKSLREKRFKAMKDIPADY